MRFHHQDFGMSLQIASTEQTPLSLAAMDAPRAGIHSSDPWQFPTGGYPVGNYSTVT